MCIYNEDWFCITLLFHYRREVTTHCCYIYWHSKVHPCYVWIQEMCQHIFLHTEYMILQLIPTCYDWFGMRLKCFMSIIYWLSMEHLYVEVRIAMLVHPKVLYSMNFEKIRQVLWMNFNVADADSVQLLYMAIVTVSTSVVAHSFVYFISRYCEECKWDLEVFTEVRIKVWFCGLWHHMIHVVARAWMWAKLKGS